MPRTRPRRAAGRSVGLSPFLYEGLAKRAAPVPVEDTPEFHAAWRAHLARLPFLEALAEARFSFSRHGGPLLVFLLLLTWVALNLLGVVP